MTIEAIRVTPLDTSTQKLIPLKRHYFINGTDLAFEFFKYSKKWDFNSTLTIFNNNHTVPVYHDKAHNLKKTSAHKNEFVEIFAENSKHVLLLTRFYPTLKLFQLNLSIIHSGQYRYDERCYQSQELIVIEFPVIICNHKEKKNEIVVEKCLFNTIYRPKVEINTSNNIISSNRKNIYLNYNLYANELEFEYDKNTDVWIDITVKTWIPQEHITLHSIIKNVNLFPNDPLTQKKVKPKQTLKKNLNRIKMSLHCSIYNFLLAEENLYGFYSSQCYLKRDLIGLFLGFKKKNRVETALERDIRKI
ncbi:hypothetical protein HZS_1646 [Henneguya salminicola]|nr:hypothetical protein HZS_1646 [Henneguya salminicola]